MDSNYKDMALAFFERKLQFETDPSDVYQAQLRGDENIVLVDTRSSEAYGKSHARGAINLPRGVGSETLPRDKTIIVYCWGPGCNGATKAAAKLAREGFDVKEMIGGIEYWEDRERYPVVWETAVQC